MAVLPPGSWEGSIVMDAHIAYFRQTRKLPSAEHVEARAPGHDLALEPCDGKRMVFGMHFVVRFGLPASRFMRQFVDFFRLQMHRLGPNFVMYTACLATLCGGNLGFWPFLALFDLFFHFCGQKNDNVSYSCGGVVIYARCGGFFPKIRMIDSIKNSQRSFFYVRSIGEGVTGEPLVVHLHAVDKRELEPRGVQQRDDGDRRLADRAPGFPQPGTFGPGGGLHLVSGAATPRATALDLPHERAQGHCQLLTVQLPANKTAAKITIDGPNSQHFAPDCEDSNAEDYESDGGDLAGHEDPDTREVEEDDDDEEEAPTDVAAGGVEMSNGPNPVVSVRD
ncbi:hypothetical protein D1007_41087 [Hordeum vulgare]|nr:hypothetical protein D1007_41087 [Hordeum vulgare]